MTTMTCIEAAKQIKDLPENVGLMTVLRLPTGAYYMDVPVDKKWMIAALEMCIEGTCNYYTDCGMGYQVVDIIS